MTSYMLKAQVNFDFSVHDPFKLIVQINLQTFLNACQCNMALLVLIMQTGGLIIHWSSTPGL